MRSQTGLGLVTGLIVLVVCSGGMAAGTPAIVDIDFVYPEAIRAPTWIDVPLPADAVTIHEIHVITGHRSWRLSICSAAEDPQSCTQDVPSADPADTRRRDFRATPGWAYTDADNSSELHLRVDPAGGDWMIFRIRLKVEAP